MKLESILVKGYRLSDEFARAYLYILENDLHDRKAGFIEDVFVEPDHRRKGHWKQIVQEIIRLAEENDCYKIVLGVQDKGAKRLYRSLGFKENGEEMKLIID